LKLFLVTGGAGFFGGLLKQRLLAEGYRCVSVDLQRDEATHPNLEAVQGDLRDAAFLDGLAGRSRFDAIFHCAAILAHAVKDSKFLWSCNVEGTRAVAELARRSKIPKLVFISSNCLWGGALGRAITEEEPPAPMEIYGRSKWEAEKVLQEYRGHFDISVIRTPTIMDAGRLGLLAILFEFIDEGRKVWVVGDGSQRYQFVYAPDLASACILSLDNAGSDVFNVGSENVKTTREVYEHVIRMAESRARVASLPKAPTLLAMKLAHLLKVSPLGPYQYRMIAEDFIFDTSKIRRKLGWRATLTNEEMLSKAFNYYRAHRDEIRNRKDVSAHRQAAPMGIIRILKWLS
jgi:nucleoside-diphosphate-sugar epimerase